MLQQGKSLRDRDPLDGYIISIFNSSTSSDKSMATQLKYAAIATNTSEFFSEEEATIVTLTLQPILKLPLLWNAKYLGLSYPIILQIV